ncbi:unnamed protein product [Gadus morhua 'NCC']
MLGYSPPNRPPGKKERVKQPHSTSLAGLGSINPGPGCSKEEGPESGKLPGRGVDQGTLKVRVCRLCIKPGHIFRECPDFKCFRCQKTGHNARECEERNAAAREEERGEQMEDKDGESDDGRGAEEETGGENEEAEKELEWRYRSDSGDSAEKDGDEQMMEQGGKAEDDDVAEDTDDERGRAEQPVEKIDEEQRQEGRGRKGGKKTKELAAKRKAEEEKTRGVRSKGPRSGIVSAQTY